MPDLISSKRLTMNKLVSKNLSTQLARQASSERSNLLLTLEIHLSYIYILNLLIPRTLPYHNPPTYPTVISHAVNSFLNSGLGLFGFEELFIFTELSITQNFLYKSIISKFTWASSRWSFSLNWGWDIFDILREEENDYIWWTPSLIEKKKKV